MRWKKSPATRKHDLCAEANFDERFVHAVLRAMDSGVVEWILCLSVTYFLDRAWQKYCWWMMLASMELICRLVENELASSILVINLETFPQQYCL